MTLRIRSATSGDAAALAAFMLEEWDRAHRGVLADELLDARRAEPPDARRRRWSERVAGGGVLVAELEGRLVGTVRIDGVDGELGPQLGSLIVAAAARRRGIGAGLMRASIGRRAAHLWVFERASGARRFHERQGFRLDGVRRLDAFGPELRMVRRAG
ncbi:GNAT family N-acetyltransferase [Arenivirga flava]|uniref:N-acetyltransferase domain-containing protein n=1 Tax=Arenivirga flava TaxID=1930060 RepID=A0AA37UF28_9MICO|nr:GNAT family N-acetyltransferase [Arenivirga flava]GMA29094.1 hypothetical protein GCM10025874_23470 [Arenivirga flava]